MNIIIEIFEEDGDTIATCDELFACGYGKDKTEALLELIDHMRMQIECSEEHKTNPWRSER